MLDDDDYRRKERHHNRRSKNEHAKHVHIQEHDEYLNDDHDKYPNYVENDEARQTRTNYLEGKFKKQERRARKGSKERSERHRSKERSERHMPKESTERHKYSERTERHRSKERTERHQSKERTERHKSKERTENLKPNESTELQRHKENMEEYGSRKRTGKHRSGEKYESTENRKLPREKPKDSIYTEQNENRKSNEEFITSTYVEPNGLLEYQPCAVETDKQQPREKDRKMSKRKHKNKHSTHDKSKERTRESQKHRDVTHKESREHSMSRENSMSPEHARLMRANKESNKRESSRKIKSLDKNNVEHVEKDSSVDKEDLLPDSNLYKAATPNTKIKTMRDKKIEKRADRIKTKRSKVIKPTHKKQSRLYYSDSEVENVNKKSRRKELKSTSDTFDKICKNNTQSENRCIDKPVNVDALYNLFYRDTDVHNESQVIKEAIKKKMYSHKQKESPKHKVSEENLAQSLKPVLLDQSNVRSKLIKVLFQRVKDLLKETEDLREERKILHAKIDSLTNEVETLKKRDTKQALQEQNIKDRLEVLADEIKITAQGTSFREEVHNILHTIQHKYQSHWEEHEHKIQKVQTQAEVEIQTLLKNIVGKYVQLNELKGRVKGTSDIVSKQERNQPLPKNTFSDVAGQVKEASDVVSKQNKNEPLHIDTMEWAECDTKQTRYMNATEWRKDKTKHSDWQKHESELMYQKLRREPKKTLPQGQALLLKIAEPIKPLRVDCDSDPKSPKDSIKYEYKSYASYLNEPDGKDSTTPTQSYSDIDRNALDFKMKETSHGKFILPGISRPIKVPYSPFTRQNMESTDQQLYNNKPTQNLSYFSENSQLVAEKEHEKPEKRMTNLINTDYKPISIKLAGKDFWRQKLLQQPVDRVREERHEHNGVSNLRNQT